MVAKKRPSKRVSLQKKYKIKARTKEHNKKLKKGKLTGNGKKKINDNFIPNNYPFKEELLQEIQQAREKMEVVKQRQKDKRLEEMNKRRKGVTSSEMQVEASSSSSSLPTSSLSHLSASMSTKFGDEMDGSDADETEGDDIKTHNLGQNSRRAYLRELRKVIDSADVILMVLDARDPMGTKSSAVEDMVLSNSRKRLVYVLNKADLVPRDVLAGWLAFLRQRQATVPFKCNTQSQKDNLSRVDGKVGKFQEGALQTNRAIGAEELLGLLKNYCRVGDTKSTISVGIVGFPNVGKSSLINSLLRTRAVGVSAMPGFTKMNQEVILDKNIRLIDSPGIVFADGDAIATALRNCINVEEMVDVLTPIQAILDKCPQQYLMQLYSIPKFKAGDCTSFLALVARSTGKLKKGGIPNTDSAARGILHDWNIGKIKFYCRPPVLSGGGAGETDTRVLDSFSKELDIFDLKEEDIRVLDALEAQQTESSFVAMTDVASGIDIQIGETSTESSSTRSVTRSSSTSSAKMNTLSSKEPKQPKELKEPKSKERKTSSASSVVRESEESNLSIERQLKQQISAADDSEVGGVDLRKAQKNSKKKQTKNIRRMSDD